MELYGWTRTRLLDRIREDGSTVLLAFSRGKDSLASWHVLRAAGFTVVPIYMDLCPGLTFVEDSLRYYEDFFQTPITRVLHPNFFHWIKTWGFQPPIRIKAVLDAERDGLLPRRSYQKINQQIAVDHGLPASTWVAVGTRITDSARRATVFKKYGPLSYHQRSFSPIFDTNKAQLIQILQQGRVKLPIDYQLFGRSFDGVDWKFLRPLAQHRPADFARVLYWFPLAYLELLRGDMAHARQNATQTPHPLGAPRRAHRPAPLHALAASGHA